MNKLTSTTDKAPDNTGFNDAPIGWREITLKQFAQSKFFSYHPTFIEYRQILRIDGKPVEKMISAQLFWFHDDTGVALVSDYWAGTISCFAFGCVHEYVELSAEQARSLGHVHCGSCYHVYKCEKCGHINAEDSSD